MRRVVFLSFLLMLHFFVMHAEETALFDIVHNESDKIDVILNIHDSGVLNVELYRVFKKTAPVNIYEFVLPDKRFTGPSVIGACYFLKIYHEDGTVKETERKCHTNTDVFKRINISMLFVLFIFLFSLWTAGFIKAPFFNTISRDRLSMLKFILTLLGENTAKISFLNSGDSSGSPLLGPLTDFMTGLASATDTGSSIESEFFSDAGGIFSRSGKNSFVLVPSFRDMGGFYSAVNSKEWSRQLVFNVSDGSALSDWSSYFAGGSRRNINISLNVPGLSGNAIMSKKNLISVEPFLLSSQLKSIKSIRSLKVSGAYLFLGVIATIIIVGSLLRTLAYYFPVINGILKAWGAI
jgi:hypothetical protein